MNYERKSNFLYVDLAAKMKQKSGRVGRYMRKERKEEECVVGDDDRGRYYS